MESEPTGARQQCTPCLSLPMISVVVPARNEETHIEACLQSLMAQTYPEDRYEILVVDGGSSDRSLEIVRRLQQGRSSIFILHNPAGIVPTAMNLGIASARGEFIVRADAHSTYPPAYLEKCMDLLLQTGADNVGGPAIATPADGTLGARLAAAVLSNPFGVGGSRFRTSMTEGFVDTVPFGAFRKDLFQRIGGFNERLGRNEDNDLNARIRQAAGKVYLSPQLAIKYFPAPRFLRFLRNNFKSSEWHLYTLAQNRRAMGLRHMIPACFTAALLVLMPLSAVSRMGRLSLLGVMVAYFAGAVYFAARARQVTAGVRLAMPWAFLAVHLTYGIGTLAGVRFLFKPPVAKPTR